ncbi:TraR/DksA C4-type zinc finger protein [Gammaproteobacteria bacterium AB-CW1]|uniref:TraR/DksA C4-type zinc finger protein n=1 Tax=Natronospira elongata TaxID=3110268 RepID=A0AAP6JFR8_9GAMM|nr:TraR/DksA C4-type zinc finger protein [Gammaproteobacteria bacterium AB-CW1]MEA5446281.1 TraR/DksA C4-type zinc finger protein [Gammaproteobacteria bacterium AB-CW1]
MVNADHFKRRLTERREALLKDIRRHLEEDSAARQSAGLREVMDTKDGSFQEATATIRQAGLMLEAEELEDIQAALGRLDRGHYGVCIVCEEPIPEKRLEAWPTAKRCRPCQEEREAEKARGR